MHLLLNAMTVGTNNLPIQKNLPSSQSYFSRQTIHNCKQLTISSLLNSKNPIEIQIEITFLNVNSCCFLLFIFIHTKWFEV